MDTTLEALKYPIGRFKMPDTFTQDFKTQRIASISKLPQRLRDVLDNWSIEKLDTPYRQDGWTVRQLVHHIADSHINAFTRFKLGLTEDSPTIRPYDQAAWCDMEDAKKMDPDASLKIIEGLHQRWQGVLSDMSDEDYKRWIHHPEMNKKLNLEFMLGMYGWHSDHHLAHITKLKERMNW